MSTITLVRHGQANTSAQDEDSYDNLSDLGRRQAEWLGEHLDATGEHFERVYCGTLRRHIQTAEGMRAHTRAEIVQDQRLNEMEFFTLANLLLDQQGIPMPAGREEFVTYMPMLLAKWEAGEIENPPESFQDFENRVWDAILDIDSGRGPSLVVTSGGLIGMCFRQAMGLNVTTFSRTCMAIMNTSMHRLHKIGGNLSMTQFNAVPHLDRPDRQFAQTHL